MTFEAIIFDCDGTLADTMPAHYEAWLVTLNRYGVDLDEDHFYAMGGWPTWQVASHLLTRAGVALDPQQIVVEKEAVFEQALASIQPITPVVDVAARYRGQLPMAVASGGLKHIVNQTLTHLGIHDWFAAIVTCEDVANHKPDPAIYLEAARRLTIPPSRCLAYEDTDPGIEAARRAGMQVVDVRTLFRPRRVTRENVPVPIPSPAE